MVTSSGQVDNEILEIGGGSTFAGSNKLCDPFVVVLLDKLRGHLGNMMRPIWVEVLPSAS